MITSPLRLYAAGLLAAVVLLLAGSATPAEEPLRRPFHPRPLTLVVEVTAVQPFGPAYRAGIQVGDRILEVDNVAVQSLPELRRLLNAAGYSARLTVQLRRTGKQTTIYVYPDYGRIGIDARMVVAYPYGPYPY